MSITIAGASVEERIRERVDSGRYADASEVVSRALDVLEIEENLQKVRALIAEAEVEVERDGAISWTPTLFDEILEEARAADRRGDPIADHVKP